MNAIAASRSSRFGRRCCGVAVFVAGLAAYPPLARADVKVVGPGGDYSNIQAAVNDLPKAGPRTVLVKEGIYTEPVLVVNANAGATSEANRIVVMADPAAPRGTVVIKPSNGEGFAFARSRYVTLKGLTITSAQHAIRLAGGAEANTDIRIEGNFIDGNGATGEPAIAVGAGNVNAWLSSNLVRANLGDAIVIEAVEDQALAGSVHLVNNTLVRNGGSGIAIQGATKVAVANNLVAANGSRGIRTDGAGESAVTLMLNNLFYQNGAGDIDPGLLDEEDAGNFFTGTTEAPGVAGCVFGDCSAAHELTEIFVNPDESDFHLAPQSPAVDRGTNTLSLDGQDLVPGVDFDGDVPPLDGNGDGVETADIGCDESTPIEPVS